MNEKALVGWSTLQRIAFTYSGPEYLFIFLQVVFISFKTS